MASPLAFFVLFPSAAEKHQHRSIWCLWQFISHIINSFLFVVWWWRQRRRQINDIFVVNRELVNLMMMRKCFHFPFTSIMASIIDLLAFNQLSSLLPDSKHVFLGGKSGNDSNYLIESVKYILRCFSPKVFSLLNQQHSFISFSRFTSLPDIFPLLFHFFFAISWKKEILEMFMRFSSFPFPSSGTYLDDSTKMGENNIFRLNSPFLFDKLNPRSELERSCKLLWTSTFTSRAIN